MNKLAALVLLIASSSALAERGSDIASNFFDALSQKDVQGFIKGDSSVVGDYIPTVNATQFISEYKGNEVSANKKYKGKAVRVKSVVATVREDFRNNPYVVINGKNQFETMHLNFSSDSQIPESLSKGQKIDFTCVGKGMVVSTPIVEKCTTTEDVAKQFYNKVKPGFMNVNSANYKPSNEVEAKFAFAYLAYEGKIGEVCKSEKECKSNLLKILGNKPEVSEENEVKIKKIRDAFPDAF